MAKIDIGFLPLMAYILFLTNFISPQEAPNAKDVHDAEVKLRADLMKNYTVDVPPPHNKSSPIRVRLNMQILSLKDLDAKTQTLTTEAWLLMKWNDSRLAWSPKNYAGVEEVRFAPHKIWQPDIEVYNSAKMSEMGLKTEVFTMVHSNGLVQFVPPVSLYTICMVDNKYYPYDKHYCIYKFGSWTHSGDHIDLQLYDPSVTTIDSSQNFYTGGEWEIVKTHIAKTDTKYACCEETYPDVSFHIMLQRRSPFYQVAIVCPLVAASIFLLASFWFSPLAGNRITLNVVAFIITLVLLMHLSSNLPAVGQYCPLILTFCGILAITSALAIALSVGFSAIITSKKNDEIKEWMMKILQSPAMKFLCLTEHSKSEILINQEDSMNIVIDGSKASISEDDTKPNLWENFFQVIDRLFFAVCLICIFAIMTAAAQSPDIDMQQNIPW